MSFLTEQPPHDSATSFTLWTWFKNMWNVMRGQSDVSANVTADFYPSFLKYYYPIDTTSGSITVILPLAKDFLGKCFLLKKIASANKVTITVSGGDAIDGSSPRTLYNQYDWIEVVANGVASWAIKSSGKGSNKGMLNLKDDYGAKGDGTTDDTVAVRTALSDVGATGRTLYAPAGTYKITSNILVQNAAYDVVILGDGMHSTIFQDNVTGAAMLTFDSAFLTLSLRDIGFRCNVSKAAFVSVDYINGGLYSKFDHCMWDGALLKQRSMLRLKAGSYEMSFESCLFKQSLGVACVEINADTVNSSNINFIGGTFYANNSSVWSCGVSVMDTLAFSGVKFIGLARYTDHKQIAFTAVAGATSFTLAAGLTITAGDALFLGTGTNLGEVISVSAYNSGTGLVTTDQVLRNSYAAGTPTEVVAGILGITTSQIIENPSVIGCHFENASLILWDSPAFSIQSSCFSVLDVNYLGGNDTHAVYVGGNNCKGGTIANNLATTNHTGNKWVHIIKDSTGNIPSQIILGPATLQSGGATTGLTNYATQDTGVQAGNITPYNTSNMWFPPGGRLSLTSATPVTSADVLTSTNVYYTPYLSNVIQLWDGVNWVPPTAFTEQTLALGTVTTALMYDVFGYLNSGALNIEKLAWTSATARATAVTLQDGRYCKSGDKTRFYLGSFYTISTSATADSGGLAGTSQVGAQRFLWNMYNRVDRELSVIDTTASWAYNTATIRQANGAAGNKVEFIVGLVEDAVSAHVASNAQITANVNVAAVIGVGVDSTTTFSGLRPSAYNSDLLATGILRFPMFGTYSGYPAVGYHYLSWNEYGADGNCTFVSSAGNCQAGLVASYRM